MRVKLPLRFGALISPCGPPGVMLSPMIIWLRRYTPHATTATLQEICCPVVVVTPVTCPFSTSIAATSP